jgi:hypothetical protein
MVGVGGIQMVERRTEVLIYVNQVTSMLYPVKSYAHREASLVFAS